MSGVTQATIQFANFLSPLLWDEYEYITSYVSISLGYPTTLYTGESLEDFERGSIDAGFLCGLQYVQLAQQPDCPVELLVAPVLSGERYQEWPIYFSDIIVRADSPFHSFLDLYECVWAYNEETSHSGYNLVLYGLLERHKTQRYFGKMVRSGSHLNSLQMVLNGEADATAIDSHVMDVWTSRNPSLTRRLRFLDAFGPSPIPPVVVSRRIDAEIRNQLRETLVRMHLHPFSSEVLQAAAIQRFVPVTDASYDAIRMMLRCVERAES